MPSKTPILDNSVTDFNERIKLAETPPGASIKNVATYGNIWMNVHYFPKAGDGKAGHVHQFDHVHFVFKGTVKIIVKDGNDDKVLHERIVTAPALIKVPKEHYHTIIAMEDDCAGACIQALNNKHGGAPETDYLGDIEGGDMVHIIDMKKEGCNDC